METTIFLSIILSLLPVPLIYLIYRVYFKARPGLIDHVEFFSFGIFIGCIVFFISYYSSGIIPSEDYIDKGFFQAALVEKAAAFLTIFLLIKFRLSKKISALDCIISSMFFGLGFATLENILFAISVHKSVIIVRLISSVPLHLLSCGMIGFFLSLMKLHSSKIRKTLDLLTAFFMPYLFHAFYDVLLLKGGASTYYISLLLVFLIVSMEYIISRSFVLPEEKVLKERGMSLEDWKIIENEPQYERWILRSMGSKNTEFIPFFRLRFNMIRILIMIFLIIVSVICFFSEYAIMEKIGISLTIYESRMLFSFLPGIYCFNLFVVGIINPGYFKNSIIRIPIIIDVVYYLPVKDITKEDDVFDSLTYHITAGNSFFKTPAPISPGCKFKCILYCSKFSSPTLTGEVISNTHDVSDKYKGTLVKFVSKPFGFWVFLIKYYVYRMFMGLSFNLHLPGSKSIRKLFVNPVSVMEEEKNFSKGEILFKQGDKGNNFYLIRSGEVNIIKTIDRDKNVLVGTLSKGDFFGEMAVFGEKPRTATAVCKTDCVIAVARADNLDALVRSNPEFTCELIKKLIDRHHSTENIMIKRIRQVNRDVKKNNVFLINIMKMIMSDKLEKNEEGRTCIFVDTELISEKLGIEKESVIRLINLINENCFDEKIDSLTEKKDWIRINELLNDKNFIIKK